MVVFRAGLVIFVGFVLWTNTRTYWLCSPGGALWLWSFLCCLGYVAAKRALDRDQQLASLHQELEVAKRIQLSILPTGFPVSPHFTVAARYVPMTAVAGDFYEFLSTGGPRCWVVCCGCLGPWSTGGTDCVDGKDGDHLAAAACRESGAIVGGGE